MNKNQAEVKYRKFKIKTRNVHCGFLCGERGIRTPGGVTLNSFQDCRIRPLCHFSLADANIRSFFISTQVKIKDFTRQFTVFSVPKS